LVKKYSTPLGSVAVEAVIEIDVVPVALGTTAQVIGLGVGAVVSGSAPVVADTAGEGVVVF
jgi:hypothetical protein